MRLFYKKMYSLVVKSPTGIEHVIASVERNDSMINIRLDIPNIPKKPWFFALKDYLTPMLLAVLVFRPYRR